MINFLFIQKERVTFVAEKNIYSYYPIHDVKK